MNERDGRLRIVAFLLDVDALVRRDIPDAESAARRLRELAAFVVAEIHNSDVAALLAAMDEDDLDGYGISEQLACYAGLHACTDDETPEQAVRALAQVQAAARLGDDLDDLRAEWEGE